MNKNRERYLARREQIKNKPPQKITLKNYESDKSMDRFNMLMVFTFFIACFYLVSNFYFLDLSLSNFFQFYFLFLALGFLISIKKYRKVLDMSIYEYILFNFMSFAPLLVCGTFLLNDAYDVKQYSESYKIESFEHSEIKAVYYLENNQYEDKEYIRIVGQKDEVVINGSKILTIHFTDGLLGIRKIGKKVID